jgi:hypothetical protein
LTNIHIDQKDFSKSLAGDSKFQYTEKVGFKTAAGPKVEIDSVHTDAHPGKVVEVRKEAKQHFDRLQTRRDALHVSAFQNPKKNGTHVVETIVDKMSPEEAEKQAITSFRVETETGLRTIKFKLL